MDRGSPVKTIIQNILCPGDFPGSQVVETWPSNVAGVSLIPDEGAKIPHSSWPKNQNIRQKQNCKKSNKDLLKGGKKNLLSQFLMGVFAIIHTIIYFVG